jgi:hypothetical protein
MARAAPKTALVNWQSVMEKEAAIAGAMEASTTNSTFFSLRGGILSLNEAPIPDNRMAVVILDSILENVYYDKPFNPDVVTAPKCFAYGRNEMTMAPHEVITELGQEENETCTGCPQNEWGTANIGRGKACSNRRRLSVIAAGKLDGRSFEPYDDEHFATSPMALLKLPVTSVKPYAAFVANLVNVLKRPPFGVFTLVSVVPDPKTQFKVTCEMIDKVPDRLLPILIKRRADTLTTLEQPYAMDIEEAAPPPPVRTRRAKY